MLTAHTVAQIRAAEETAGAAVGFDALMQQAAAGLAERLLELIPAGEAVVVLVGPGNNGGDALFAAAALCQVGRRVNLCLLDPAAVHLAGLEAAVASGAKVVDSPAGHRFVVDALFGIGGHVGLTGKAADWANWVEADRPLVVAVDVPSGIGVDDGTLSGPAIRADHTVTFATRKYGLLVGPAAAFAGEVSLVDIGLDFAGEPVLTALEAGDVANFKDRLVPTSESHKYTRGIVGISAGSAAYPGAAHLCVAGAQAGPAGMVRFAGEQQLAMRVIDRAPEVVAATGRADCWVVGPGGDDSAAPLQAALATGSPIVVDASALAHLPGPFETDALLTPHAGELARLLAVTSGQVAADPLRFAREAAQKFSATVLLKGARTIIAAPDGRVAVNISGTSWLATAGAGDVLAGLAGSLLAAGLTAFEAGSLAALLHGLAADEIGGPFVASELAVAASDSFAGFVMNDGSDGR